MMHSHHNFVHCSRTYSSNYNNSISNWHYVIAPLPYRPSRMNLANAYKHSQASALSAPMHSLPRWVMHVISRMVGSLLHGLGLRRGNTAAVVKPSLGVSVGVVMLTCAPCWFKALNRPCKARSKKPLIY